jgi:colicin import membrane protein
LKAEAGGVSQGAIRPLKGKRPKGRSATTPISPFPISPSAGGHAGGTGRPAEENSRLPAAGGAGGHAAARASQDEGPACRPWTGSAAEAYRFMRERLEAEKADRDAKDAADAARLAEMKRQAAAAPPPPNATDAAAALTDAVAQLPAASRKKAKKVGKKMSKADRQAEADADRLKAMIEEKRRAMETTDPAKAKALKAAATEAWKTKRARPAAAAQEANV